MNSSNTLFHEFSNEWITREHGLPSHQIHQMLFFERKLWLATPNGLAIFDGEQVNVLDQKQGLLTHGIRALACDKPYILVCSDRGVDKLDANSTKLIQNISTVDLGLGCCQAAIKIAADKYLLACANGLRIWDTTTSQLQSLNSPLDDDFIINMVGYDQNSILIQSKNSGLWLYQAGKLEPFIRQQIAEYGTPHKICQQNDYIWLLTEKFVIQLDTEFHIIESIALPSDFKAPRTAFYDQLGELYIADNQCLIVMAKQQESWQVIRHINDDVLVNTIKQDSYGNLWVATDFSGLMKISALNHWIKSYRSQRNNSILSLQLVEPAPPSTNIATTPYNKHNTTDEELLLIGGTSYSFYAPKQMPSQAKEILGLRGLACWDLNFFADIGFWAATDIGLIQFDDIEQENVSIFSNESVGAGRCLTRYDNQLIYGSISGLYCYQIENKKLSPLLDDNQHTIGYVYAIKIISDSLFYIATLGNGLWLYHCKTQKLQKLFQSLNLSNVYAVDIDTQHRTILAVDNSIWLIENEQAKKVFEVNESVAAWCVHWYSPTQVILGTSQGLKVFDLVSKTCTFIIDNFPKHKFWEFTTSRSLVKGAYGVFWCGLNEGLQSVNLNQLVEIITPPVPEIKSLNSSNQLTTSSGYVELTEGSWSLEVCIGCFWLWQEQSLHYKYRLVGLHSGWHVMDGARIEFTTLPVGDYILEISTNSSLAQSTQNLQLLKITVKSNRFFGQLHLKLSNWLNNLVNKYRTLRQLSSIQQNYETMERRIKHRTLELFEANQALSVLNVQLENLSNRDQLTDLYNRRYYFEQLETEIKRAMRDEQPLTVMMIDIDFFKNYNDNYGHLAGDVCLKNVAQALQKYFFRSGELLARFGGEEFIVLMHNTDLKSAVNIANKCVKDVYELAIPHAYSECAKYITISIGLSMQIPIYHQGSFGWVDYRQQAINQADQALYRAKAQGRNQVQHYENDDLETKEPQSH
ncbi:GGDEF domain-containing protein [Colwellia sp. BRX10-3]|uniref:ligand-binding sensor domain-containing diguanylate cyclase n=1 Tax=Colwellia sp. BRX10-3 TaxID=2759844 RepID=UPI0015F4C191|nr:diguanylate cyclase [Colwellia sp. BRX10-3]MBA6391323.1 GGDEF domain-containing protein [Colwellia sp. BRX10-3]